MCSKPRGSVLVLSWGSRCLIDLCFMQQWNGCNLVIIVCSSLLIKETNSLINRDPAESGGLIYKFMGFIFLIWILKTKPILLSMPLLIFKYLDSDEMLFHFPLVGINNNKNLPWWKGAQARHQQLSPAAAQQLKCDGGGEPLVWCAGETDLPDGPSAQTSLCHHAAFTADVKCSVHYQTGLQN